jgi:lysophospholipase L1-like esterase
MRRRIVAVAIVSLAGMMMAGCASTQTRAFRAVGEKSHSAVTPVQQTAEWAVKWWGPRHEAVSKELVSSDVQLLFIGDSITHGWEGGGKEIWDQYYAPRKAVNMGFGGDRTQHVLWRLDDTQFGCSPKLAILMIGTNNSNGTDNTAEEIADGIIAICQRLRERLPRTKILMLAIFPRNPGPGEQREKNAEASRLASRIADDKMIYYLDINKEFLTDDDVLTKAIMPDYLHPNATGYKIWAEAIEPTVSRLMGERP